MPNSNLDDFRSHTCGECGYISRTGLCRKDTFGFFWPFFHTGENIVTMSDGLALGAVANDEPACPDFVPHEKEKSDGKA